MTLRVGVADWRVTTDDVLLATSGLGSCVAVAVYDPDAGVGGLLNAMLPEAPEVTARPAKYVDDGLAGMVAEMEAAGASRDDLAAKLAGGSAMLDLSVGGDVGAQNVAAAERELAAAGVHLVEAATGGSGGRSVSFRPRNGELTVERVYAEVLVL